jgi:uncharacterized membrane protein YfcA
MIAVGIEPHVAVATNMLALTFLSVGASLSCNGKDVIERRILPLGIVLTVIGSAVGALLLLRIPTRGPQLTIALAMVVIAAFSLLRRDSDTAQRPVSSASKTGG